jgi:hypothetical protein
MTETAVDPDVRIHGWTDLLQPNPDEEGPQEQRERITCPHCGGEWRHKPARKAPPEQRKRRRRR